MSSVTITRHFCVDGQLTDATAAVLSDAAGAYGVKRNDTGAVVVPAGTAATRISNGTYTCTFNAVDGVAYTAKWQFSYDGEKYWFVTQIPATASGNTLATDYTEIRQAICRYLGYDADKLTSLQESDLGMILKSGLRRFYTPPLLPGERYSHEWSFLHPVKTLSLVAGQSVYALPVGFAMLDGPLVLTVNDETKGRRIDVTSEFRVREKLAGDAASGQPTMAAIRPLTFDGNIGTRYELLLFPVPDNAYAVTYRYRVGVDVINSTERFPPGGEIHAETILESCLAVAEARMNDSEDIHAKQFVTLLAASVSRDRLASCPDTLGYNGDDSDRIPVLFRREPKLILYNGVNY